MNISPYAALKDYFGYEDFLGRQEEIITRTLADPDNHSLVLMPTGGGKSLCYQIPALCLKGRTLVISPLISLMKDQVDSLKTRGIKAGFINSTLSRDEREKRLESFLYGELKILYLTPERLKQPDFMDRIKRADIDLLAVDEAHCISAWGHDFRPDYSLLGLYREQLGSPRTLALTASATKEVQEDIIRALHLDKENCEIFHQGIRRPNLHIQAEEVIDDDARLENILTLAASNPGSGIVYFSLIKTLEAFSSILDQKGISHLMYHGKLEHGERKRVQNRFMEGHELILATNAFGMGIDKKDIRLIIHAEMPGSVESYYQEIGRAGRDGKKSLCSLIYNQEDLMIHMDFINWSNPEPAFYHKLYLLLEKEMDKLNSLGLDYLKEQLVYKNRFDFRLETALSVLERHEVITGSLHQKNLKLLSSLPAFLTDRDSHEKQISHARMKLLGMVNFFRSEDCRFAFLDDYFSLPRGGDCGNCDRC